LFDLHSQRWGRRSEFYRLRGFHREFAAVAEERGWLRLWFLEMDGVAVAAWYGFRYAGVESFYQGGRDMAWAEGGVGTVLLEHTIREAQREGMSEYRFLRGGEAYKDRLANGSDDLVTVARHASVAGAALVAATKSGNMLRTRLGRIRRRLGIRRPGDT
jgi:CelD/BcsL family acetyltransferase involved in cellulose biosynthesis